jgi:hypothetical protein
VQRVVRAGVLAVQRVEQATGLVAELELRPDVADTRDVVELEARGARAGRRRGDP